MARPKDTLGIGYVINNISSSQITYLQQGGIASLIGDGALSYMNEQIFEAFYSVKIYQKLFISADYQQIINPAYNSARGPVNFFGLRAHIGM